MTELDNGYTLRYGHVYGPKGNLVRAHVTPEQARVVAINLGRPSLYEEYLKLVDVLLVDALEPVPPLRTMPPDVAASYSNHI